MISKTIDSILPNLISATLSKPVPQAPYLKIKIRQIAGNKRRFFVEQFTSTQSFHAAMTRQETGEFLKEQIGVLYKNAVLEAETAKHETELLHFLTNKKGKTTIIRKKLQSTPRAKKEEDSNSKTDNPSSESFSIDKTDKISQRSACTLSKAEYQSHNRKKQYLIEEGKPVQFLQHLGVMSIDGTVIADKYSKFKQINRFLEFIDDILEDIIPKDGKPLSIVDFGCGKSYLTFAVYHYLSEIKGIPVSITGLDLKDDVITLCTTLAKEFQYTNLEFKCASIESYFERLSNEGLTGPDLVISLHACDTATDYALASAIAQKTKAILCVPCCQHELNTSLQKEKNLEESAFSPFYRFGLIRERFSSLATDLLRALLLEQHNYDVQVLEFVDFSHTPKNILIRALLKKNSIHSKKPEIELTRLQKNLHKSLCLENLLSVQNPKKADE